MRSMGMRWAVAVLGAIVAIATGCGSDAGGRTDESKKAVESLRAIRQELVKGKAEVQQANASLDKLAAGENLAQTYKRYTTQVASLKAAGDRARARAQDMRARSRDYAASWEKEMDQVSSPELRAGASDRRAKVKQDFDKLSATARSGADAYRPYLRNLQEIQIALASDLTPAGVDSAKPVIQKAKADGEALQQRIDDFIAQIDEVSGSMSGGNRPAAAN